MPLFKTPSACFSLLHFTPILSLSQLLWKRGFPYRLITSSQFGGLPHQCNITSLQETPGSSRNPGLPCLPWVLQKPLSSLGISEPPRHLQSSPSTPVPLQLLHSLKLCCCDAWKGAAPPATSASSKAVVTMPGAGSTQGLRVFLCPPSTSWSCSCGRGFKPQTERHVTLYRQLWKYCISGFPVALLGSAVSPRAWPQWGNHRWQSLFLSPHT